MPAERVPAPGDWPGVSDQGDNSLFLASANGILGIAGAARQTRHVFGPTGKSGRRDALLVPKDGEEYEAPSGAEDFEA